MKKSIKSQLLIASLISAIYSSHASAAYPVTVINFPAFTVPIVTAVTGASTAIVGAITTSTAAIVSALQMQNAQSRADMQQQNSFNKALTEGAQNYDKMYRLQEHAARVNKERGGTEFNSARMDSGCEAMMLGGTISNGISAKQDDKAMVTKQLLSARLVNEDAHHESRVAAKLHADLFCSTEDVSRGRCTKVADEKYQNADLKATNFLEPNETATYDETQKLAAESYMRDVVNNGASQAMPKALEKTAAGKAYVAKQVNEQRKIDLAANSMAEMYAMRLNNPGLGAKAGLTQTPDISVMGVIKTYATKFLDPAWTASFGSMSSEDLIAEQTRLMAFSTFMDYQTFLQQERMESLIATQLLEQVKGSSRAELASLRKTAQDAEGRRIK